MPEENTMTVENATQGESAERTFTQAEVDAIVGERLKRERSKYADYSELLEKAKAYDADQEASKSELQKAIEQRDSYKSQLDTLKAEAERAEQVRTLAAKHNVDAEMLARMSGDVEENAAFLASKMADAPKYGAIADKGEAKKQVTNEETFVHQLFKN